MFPMIAPSLVARALGLMVAMLVVGICVLGWRLDNRIARVAELETQEKSLREVIQREQQAREVIKRNDQLKERLYAEQSETLRRTEAELARVRSRTKAAIAATPESSDWGSTNHPRVVNCLLSRAYRDGAPCTSGTPDTVSGGNTTP